MSAILLRGYSEVSYIMLQLVLNFRTLKGGK